MNASRNTKHTLFTISSDVCMLVGFIAGIVFSILLLLPSLKSLGTNPNRFIPIFVVLPIVVLIGTVFSFLGIAITLVLWKPFLTPQQAKKFVFGSRTPEEAIPRVIHLPLVKPYYKLAGLIYPQINKWSVRKARARSIVPGSPVRAATISSPDQSPWSA